MRSLFRNPTDHRLRLGWRLLAHLALLVVLYISVAIFLAPLWALTGLSETSSRAFLIESIGSLFAITASVFLARRWFDRRSFISLGLAWYRRAARDLLAGVGIGGLVITAIYAVQIVLGWLRFAGFAWQSEAPGAIVANLLLYLVIFILVGWQEELLCRGYWLHNLSDGLGLGWGVLISSWAFAVLHALNPYVTPQAVFLLIGAGLFMACGYLRTRQLWLSIGLHIGWNFFEGPLFGFAVSGTSSFTLIRQIATGPQPLTGGAFGPEAGLIVLPGLALGVILIYWYTRKNTRDQGTENRGKGVGDMG
jgi:membrane protease YdiL (CAAX protease family)